VVERTIRAVRARRISALALGLLALGGATAPSALADVPPSALAGALARERSPVRARASARSASRHGPTVTAAHHGPTVTAAHHGPTVTAAHHGPTVTAALQSLLHNGAIAEAVYLQDYNAYVAAKRSLGRLTGTRNAELGAVLANVQAMAAVGELVPSRLPAVFLTLERNRQWWTTEPLLASDERVSFPSSKLIWEHYPGQGLEIQWLATFGEGNGYYLSGHENANLRQLIGEILPLATQRAGGIAWEYLFQFDGGQPPWTSGLSQGTGLEMLARAYSRFKEPADLAAAQQALGIFETAPPQGVRVSTPAGALYAEYTYAPSDKILNGFIQSLVGLYEYTAITQDPLGLSLFEAGDAEARVLVPHYNTGAWSLYDQFGESDLNYHELLTEFLQHLCERTQKGPPAAPSPSATAPSPTTTTTTTPAPSTPTSGTGGASASSLREAAHLAQAGSPIAADEIYCTTAQSFTSDLHAPPAIALLSTKLRGGTRAGVQMSLSKISTVDMTVRLGARAVWSNSATVERGKPKLLWITPSTGGTFTVTLTATDLAGNFATTSGTIVVSPH
jgi:D-glucuronyl C5-epimerase-like protein